MRVNSLTILNGCRVSCVQMRQCLLALNSLVLIYLDSSYALGFISATRSSYSPVFLTISQKGPSLLIKSAGEPCLYIGKFSGKLKGQIVKNRGREGRAVYS